MPRPLPLLASVAISLALASCAGGATSTATTTRSVPTTTSSSAPAQTSSVPAPPATSTSPATTRSTPTGGTSCADTAYAALSPEQRIGQLLMVGLDTSAPAASLDDEIDGHHVGNVILLGGWEGRAKVAAAVRHLTEVSGPKATGDIVPFIAVDQEGGEVHQLRGDGFTRPPSALEQGRLAPAALTTAVTAWGREVAATGVNVNLAPVADTVPASLGRANEPIGKWGRQFSSDPARNARLVPAFIAGMHKAGLAATVKHFPGLGRITSNTDFSSSGITDSVATTKDAYLAPFAAGIAAGTDFVMVSSARYPRLDPDNQAVFSRPILTTLLRGQLGWKGVTITDDMGNAKAVSATAPGERAVRFLRAGGDMILTGQPTDIGPMLAAIEAAAAKDARFAALVEASVHRVLALKQRRGLLPACP